MARIYFSLSYADFKSAGIVYSACKINKIPNPIFFEQAVWNEARNKGDGATRELIDRALVHADLTVFLIGRSTYCDAWCAYALRKSIENKKGVFGIHLPNQMQPGKAEWLSNKGVQVYEWQSNGLRSWIMAAIQESLTKASLHRLKDPPLYLPRGMREALPMADRPREMDSFLTEPRVARLASVNPDGSPHVVPLVYLFDPGAGTFFFSTGTESLTARNFRRNPAATVCVDDGEYPFRAVVAEGAARLTEAGSADFENQKKLVDHFYGPAMWAEWKEKPHAHKIRVRLTVVPKRWKWWDQRRGLKGSVPLD